MVTNHALPKDFKEDIFRNIKLVFHFIMTIIMYFALQSLAFPTFSALPPMLFKNMMLPSLNLSIFNKNSNPSTMPHKENKDQPKNIHFCCRKIYKDCKLQLKLKSTWKRDIFPKFHD